MRSPPIPSATPALASTPALIVALLAGLASGLLVSPARADVVHLKNGRTLEGKVVSRTAREVRLRTAEGLVVLPTSVIAGVARQETPEAELATRAAGIDLNDPAAIEALALWASSRGMGEQGRDLLALARGLRLERLVAQAQRTDDPAEFVAVFHWGRTNEASDEVLEWLLEQARRRALPDDPEVAAALELRADDLALRARDEARRAELLRRPRYLDPEQERRLAASLAPGASARLRGDAGRGARLLERARASSPAAAAPPAAAGGSNAGSR